jgi:hypothetical protein
MSTLIWVTISSDDFFVTTAVDDPWGGPAKIIEDLDTNRLAALIDGPEPGQSDLSVSLALMDLIRNDLTRSGTGTDPRIPDVGLRLAIRTLKRVTARIGAEFDLPFRDHTGWREWWIRNGAKGSYRARRDLLHDLFYEFQLALEEAEDDGPGGIPSLMTWNHPHDDAAAGGAIPDVATERGWPLRVGSLTVKYETHFHDGAPSTVIQAGSVDSVKLQEPEQK